MTRWSALIGTFAAAAALGSTGCYQYHVARCSARPLSVAEAVDAEPGRPACVTPEWDPATEWETRTVHSLLWGLVRTPEYLFTTVCPAQTAIDQVRVHDNLGFAAVTVLTLGIWAPKRIGYTCTRRLQEAQP
ncbi:MAG TPA: hypothetical protein VK939_13855 [Longimicrobiales bacterium]|nr:hypothetical protein [Longimicrobiales bacterium]